MVKMRIITSCLGVITSLLLTAPASAASLALSPANGSVGRGCSFSVGILVDTQSVETDGNDVILTYDPLQFTAVSVVNGTIFNDYPGNAIDNQTGRVNIYALASQDTVFNGSGTVATVNFTASSSATLAPHPINFDFDSSNPTKTTDSNVIQKGTTTDVLKSVTNGSYAINANSCDQAVAVVAQGQTASDSARLSTLPSSGTFSTTLMVIAAGLGMILAGLLGLSYNHIRTHDSVRPHH